MLARSWWAAVSETLSFLWRRLWARNHPRAKLHRAIRQGNSDAVRAQIARDPGLVHGRYLFSEFAVEGAWEPYHQTLPLHEAAAWGHAAVVDVLLAHRAEVDEAEIKSQRTALHAAAVLGHGAVVERLCAAGAGPNAADQSGRTPLHLCLLPGGEERTPFPFSIGPVFHFEAWPQAPANPDFLGIAARLLDAGADPDVRDIWDLTPLAFAVRDSEAAVRLLLAHGARPDQGVWDAATELDHRQIIELLLAAGGR